MSVTNRPFLVTGSSLDSLSVNGVDYTSSFVSWGVSDSSALAGGLVSTNGTLIISGTTQGPLTPDYDRNDFRRGAEVVLELTEAVGMSPRPGSYRHPRGLLYVISTLFDVEAGQLSVTVGCRIALAILNDDVDALLPYTGLPLEDTQKTVSGVGASLAGGGKYIYQNNQGNILIAKYFDGETNSGSGPVKRFTSVLGGTSLSVQPLAGTGAIPDKIVLSYQQPLSYGDTPATEEIVTTVSDYFVTYPAVMYERTGSGLGAIGGVTEGTVVDSSTTSACGNTPPPPQESQKTPACNEGYSLVQTPAILPATRTAVNTTKYTALANQVSVTESVTTGPAVEANSQYFADSFAYCRYTWSTRCNPNGSCSTAEGMQDITLNRTLSTNFYGSAGELIKTVTDSFSPTLSGAQPFDWRSGVVNGAPQGFQTLSLTDMYRESRAVTEYYKEGDISVQETTTYTSVTSRGSGIKTGTIDALSGIRTKTKRSSATISASPLAPDASVSPQRQTITKISEIGVPRQGYITPPSEAGPNTLNISAPVPYLLASQELTDQAVAEYQDHVLRSTLGESYGLQIAEPVTEEISNAWTPSTSFYYVDPGPGGVIGQELIMTMRMDATVWGVDQRGSTFVTNGIWTGFSDGQLAYTGNPDGNVVGAGGTTGARPYVANEISESVGSFVFYVDVHMAASSYLQPLVEEIVFKKPASSYTPETYSTFTVWTSGFVVGPGSLSALGPNGSKPLSNNGNLLIEGATVITEDLFAGYTGNNAEGP